MADDYWEWMMRGSPGMDPQISMDPERWYNENMRSRGRTSLSEMSGPDLDPASAFRGRDRSMSRAGGGEGGVPELMTPNFRDTRPTNPFEMHRPVRSGMDMARAESPGRGGGRSNMALERARMLAEMNRDRNRGSRTGDMMNSISSGGVLDMNNTQPTAFSRYDTNALASMASRLKTVGRNLTEEEASSLAAMEDELAMRRNQ